MKSKKILFANFPCDGHFGPLTSLAVHLKNMGHDVRWYAGIKYEPKIKGMGIPYFPLKNAIDFSLGDADQIFPDRRFQKGLIAKLKFDIKYTFVLRGPEFYEDIKSINESFPFDILIADNCFTGLSFVKQLMGKPVIAIGVMPMVETSKDLAPMGLGLTPASTFLGKRWQDIMRFIMDKLVFKESKKLIDRIYKAYGMETVGGNVFDIVSREADMYLQSGAPGFEYKRSDMRQNVRFIGPLLPYTRDQHMYLLPEQFLRFKKKVLVTQGTVETDVEKIIVPTLEAFKNTDVLVIATTGGAKTQELRSRYPDPNFLIEDFIPFNEIMPECDVYITNGGYGGVLLSIQNRLPMVVAGIHEGKNEINARVGYFQLGINLKTEKPTASKIRQGVNAVLENREYKRNVAALAEEFAAYVPAWLCEKYINQVLHSRERGTRATFLRMVKRNAEERVY